MTSIRKLIVLLVVATFAATTATAGAQSPTDTVYAPDSGVADVVASATPEPTPEAEQPAPTAAPADDDDDAGAAPTTSSGAAPETPAATPAPATPTTTEQVQQSGELPFTGMEAGFLGLAGLALLGGGMLMRRLTRDDS